MSAMTGRATSACEQPVFIPCGDSELFGILTTPAVDRRKTGVLLVWGTGRYPCSGQNQIRTTLARDLAAQGFHVLRFDLSGIGDSPGEIDKPDFQAPPYGDVVAAFAYLSSLGLDRMVIVAKCFGGRTTLAAAQELGDLDAIALISTPLTNEVKSDNVVRHRPITEIGRQAIRAQNLRRYLGPERRGYAIAGWKRIRSEFLKAKRALTRRALPAETQVSRLFRQLDPLLESGGQALVIVGMNEPYFADLQTDRESGRLGELELGYPTQVQVETVAGRVHGFGRIQGQERVSELLQDWLDRSFPVSDDPTSP